MEIATIQKRIALLEKYKKEISDSREMLKEELENNAEYREAVEEANAANSKKKRIKEEIINSGSTAKLAQSMKEAAEEIATLKEILSAELMQIYKEEGKDEIADQDGDSRKFKVMVTLLPKGAKVQKRDNFGKYSPESESDQI